MLYSMGVWAPAAARCVAAGFYALKDTKTPAITGLFAVGLCIGLNLLLMHRIGFLSFALNTAIAQIVDFSLLYLLFRRKAGSIGGRATLGLMLKVAGISLLSGLFTFGLFRVMIRLGHQRSLMVLAEVIICGCAGLVCCYFLSRLFRIAEVKATLLEFWTPLRRRLGK